jgi:hypothetical protein
MQVKVVKFQPGMKIDVTAKDKILLEVIFNGAFEVHDVTNNVDVVVIKTSEVPFNNTVAVILPAGSYVVQDITE